MNAKEFIKKFGWEEAKECQKLLRPTLNSSEIESINHKLMSFIYSGNIDILEFRKDLEAYISAYDFLLENRRNPYIEMPFSMQIQIEQAIALVKEINPCLV